MTGEMISTRRSETLGKFAEAMAKAQGEFESVEADATVKGKTFDYTYATLDSIVKAARKSLSANGIAVIQTPLNEGGGPDDKIAMETILIHSSGEWIEGTLTLPIVIGKMNLLQALGSAISYARRYTFAPMVGITVGDDDDGQGANPTPTMTPEELLNLLNRVTGEEGSIKGFYDSPAQIFHSLNSVNAWPRPEDIDSWREIFTMARTHAIESIESQKALEATSPAAPAANGWEPPFSEFYKHMELLLPGLLRGCEDSAQKQAVVSNLCKSYAKIEKWKPELSAELKGHLLELEQQAVAEITSGEVDVRVKMPERLTEDSGFPPGEGEDKILDDSAEGE